MHNPSVAQSNLDNQEAELHDIVQALYAWFGFQEGCQAGVVLGCVSDILDMLPVSVLISFSRVELPQTERGGRGVGGEKSAVIAQL